MIRDLTATLELKQDFAGKVLLIGLGSIGFGLVPLLFRHIQFTHKDAVTIITREDRSKQGAEILKKFGVPVRFETLTSENYLSILDSIHLTGGDILINLSVDISSAALINYCNTKHVLYVDTCTEPWPGRYHNSSLPLSHRSNYALREEMLLLAKSFPESSPTAIITHGANPGMISHFAKQALLNIAKEQNLYDVIVPTTREEWARLAMRLGVKAMHISERDTQVTKLHRNPNQFYNTWSVDGFLSEGCQPAELGWGTHERALPADGHHHESGCQAAIYLDRPGASTRVRSWTPSYGPHTGFLITHSEAISIADFFTVLEPGTSTAIYRPTVFYAYRPCDSAVLALEELAANNFNQGFFKDKCVLLDEITDGTDELGVLVMGTHEEKPFAYWYGSQLDIRSARELVEFNTATTLQVTSAVLAAVIWMIRNPRKGLLEADDIPHDEILSLMMPYISPVVGVFTEWTPLNGRGILFPMEDIDNSDPWQFKNMRQT